MTLTIDKEAMIRMQVSPTAVKRFENYTVLNSTTGCWEFKGNKDKDGYGKLRIGAGRRIRTHRLILMLNGVDVPDNMFVCHKCDNPCCVNPSHLYVGTNSENQKENYEKGRHNVDHGSINGNRNKNKCKRGHEFTPKNTALAKKDGKVVGRVCRACRRIYDQRRRASLTYR